MAYDKKTFLSGIVDAVNKKHNAQSKLRADIAKSLIRAQTSDNQRTKARSENQRATQERDKVNNPQKYTPEQQLLRRRFIEENPIMQTALPTEGQDMSQGISMPTNQVTQNPKTKTLSVTPSTSADGLETQNRNMKAKIAEMEAKGQKPNAMILKIISLQDQELARRQQIGKNKVNDKILTVKQLQDEYKRLDLLDTTPGSPEHKQRVTQMESIDKRLRQLFNPAEPGQEAANNAPPSADTVNTGAADPGANEDDLIPGWVPQDQVEQFQAAKDAGYSEEEIKSYLGV